MFVVPRLLFAEIDFSEMDFCKKGKKPRLSLIEEILVLPFVLFSFRRRQFWFLDKGDLLDAACKNGGAMGSNSLKEEDNRAPL